MRHQHYDFRDLYEEYPDFHIPAFRERKRIGNYERIIFHFPLIWFGIPPLLKLWMDEVFDVKWQKEDINNPMEGQEAIILVTTNFREQHFTKEGLFGHTMDELLSGLFIALNQNNITITDVLYIYNVDGLSKKEIINYKQNFQKILKENE